MPAKLVIFFLSHYSLDLHFSKNSLLHYKLRAQVATTEQFCSRKKPESICCRQKVNARGYTLFEFLRKHTV